MKKTVRAVVALTAFLTFVSAPYAFAEDKPTTAAPATEKSAESTAGGAAKTTSTAGSTSGNAEKGEDGGTFVYVTEAIPGAKCELKEGTSTAIDKRVYKCPIQSGFSTITGVLGSLIKYATYLTGLVWVLMIVLSGIQYSLSGGGEDAKKAKTRIIQLITGLVLLFLTGLILNTVAPWVYN